MLDIGLVFFEIIIHVALLDDQLRRLIAQHISLVTERTAHGQTIHPTNVFQDIGFHIPACRNGPHGQYFFITTIPKLVGCICSGVEIE